MDNGSDEKEFESLVGTLLPQLEYRAEPDSTVAGVIAAEPASGIAFVVCWNAPDGERRFEVVDATGTVLAHATAIREACALAAMAESLRDLCGGAATINLADRIGAWTTEHPAPHKAPRDLPPRLDDLARCLHALGTVSRADHPTVARPQQLDQMTSMHRAAEHAWEGVAPIADAWLADDDESRNRSSRTLGELLSLVARGPLAHPASSVVQAGRAAGVALAESLTTVQRQ